MNNSRALKAVAASLWQRLLEHLQLRSRKTTSPMTTASLLRALSVIAIVSASPVIHAQGTPDGVVPISDKGFPGYVVDDVVVPVPSEIFSVLDKLGEPNWHLELHDVKSPDTGDRTRLSLVFGSVVAEGFIAVQAKDKKKVEEIGKEVLALATKLAIKGAVQSHAQSILDAADKNDWPSIRKEFDLTQKTVRDTMEKMKDNDLGQCVSIGGWLRGTAAVTSVVGKNFSTDRSELLQQPMLVNHFLSQITKMSAAVKDHATMKAITTGLQSIKTVMEKSANGFTADSVAAIDKTAHQLIELINGKTKE
jgi:hypothetical protein